MPLGISADDLLLLLDIRRGGSERIGGVEPLRHSMDNVRRNNSEARQLKDKEGLAGRLPYPVRPSRFLVG
jgi:hypothetical protein